MTESARTAKDRIVLEPARAGDLPDLLDILNHYVLEDHCTFDTQPWTCEAKQAWFDAFDTTGPYRLLVARQAASLDGRLLGYAHSGQWRSKRAYDVTVETTVYLAPDARGQGLGARLLGGLLESLRGTGALRAVAGIAQPNEASNRLHLKLGYRTVGTFHRVGRKFDRDWDVTWFERDIEGGSTNVEISA
ncbi:MAG: N-acetyltransferase family protein [Xanthomonadales bacterium]|jgi:phosphinothricin acetyltransferase|nr:N-acetyltransferase family protein [Xanthomonadales bacterium]